MATCEHKNFCVNAAVNRIEDVGRFQADIRITCDDCGLPFLFIGLPAGLNLNGAAVSADAEEGRFAIAPKGQVITAIEGRTPAGFSVRKTNDE